MKPYLSDVLDVTELKKGQANIIIAPCHSGKTTAIAKIIKAHAKHPEGVLVLIDTAAGKQAILTRKEANKYTARWQKELKCSEWWEWGGMVDGDKCRVMTYHQFGMELAKYPDFVKGLEVIVADEMHNLLTYIAMEQANNQKNETNEQTCQMALRELVRVSNTNEEDSPLFVVMSATADKLTVRLDRMGANVEPLDYTDKVHCDDTEETIYYENLDEVLAGLGEFEKALVYVPQVKQVKHCMELLDDGWRRVCGLWSVHNTASPMNEEQLEVRKQLIKSERVPEDIDVLVVNAAYETSININNEDYQTIIVHTSDADKQVQVRGRLRHNIKRLYLHDSDHEHVAAYFPEEYYDKLLFKEEQEEIEEKMQLKNDNGRLMKWPSIKELLKKDGLTVVPIKHGGRRAWTVHPKLSGQNSGDSL